MIKSTNSLSVRHFADDTLTATGKDLDVLIHQTNCEVPLIIYEWLWSDKLPLNAMQILDFFSAMSGPRLNYKKRKCFGLPQRRKAKKNCALKVI